MIRLSSDCVEYEGHIRKDGYGWRNYEGKPQLAHRVVLMELGIDLTGVVVRHACDNRKCINAEHLIVGTQQENMVDRSMRSRRTKTMKLLPEQVLEARAFMASGTTPTECAKRFGVTPENMMSIRSRKTWRHI